MKTMITVDALREALAAGGDVVLLDCRFDLTDKDYGRRAYEAGHIPGAYRVDFEKDLTEPGGAFGGNHPFLTPEAFGHLLERFGVKEESLVVCYDEGDLVGPSRLLYQGLYSGLRMIRVLSGGIEAWKAAGGELTTEAPAPAEKGQVEIHEERRWILTQEEVKARKDLDGHLLIDSRSHPRYLGESEPLYAKAGHIPGAKNYFYADITEEGHLKDEAFLQDHFKGLADQKEVILSCGSGASACVNALGLLELSIEPTLYNGSYSDWIANDDNPVATGEE